MVLDDLADGGETPDLELTREPRQRGTRGESPDLGSGDLRVARDRLDDRRQRDGARVFDVHRDLRRALPGRKLDRDRTQPGDALRSALADARGDLARRTEGRRRRQL